MSESHGRKGAETRERMLEVAGRLFAEKGYEGAHLESIAKEVGVRKTALYYYFESKEALYIAVLEAMLSEFERGLGERYDPKVRKREMLEQGVMTLNQVLASNPTYAQILMRIFVDRVPIDATRIVPFIERLLVGTIQFFEEGVEEGSFRKLHPRHFALSVLGMAIFHYAGGAFSAGVLEVEDIHAPDVAELRGEEFRDLLLRGILLDPKE